MQNGIKQKKSGVDVLHQRRKEIDEKEKEKTTKASPKEKKSSSVKKSKKAKKWVESVSNIKLLW